MVQYIYTKKLSVPISLLSIIDNTGLVLYYLFFLSIINKLKGVPLWKMYVFGNMAKLFNVLQATVFFPVPIWLQLSLRVVNSLSMRLSGEFFILSLIARVGRYLPEGFETTGVVATLSTLNLSSAVCIRLGSS
jgi:hypothetical protein